MINVTSEVRVYELDGKDTHPIDYPRLFVRSHWNRDALVVLEINGAKYTIAAGDLIAATNNATNNRRFG